MYICTYGSAYCMYCMYSASQSNGTIVTCVKMAPRRDLKKLSINPLLGNFATV